VTVTDTIQRSATDAGADKSTMRGRGVLRDPQLNRGAALSAGRLRAAGSEVMATATENKLRSLLRTGYPTRAARMRTGRVRGTLLALMDRGER
jgi:hypothetical protein